MKTVWFQVAGMCLCFAWVFCSFPPVDVDVVIQASLQNPEQVLLRLAIVGVVPGLLIPAASSLISSRPTKLVLFAVGCLLRLLGCYLSLVAFRLEDPFPLLFVRDFLMGCGTTVSLIFWGVLLHGQDIESNEKIFIASFAAVGLLVFSIGMFFSLHVVVFLFVMPLVELACYAIVCARCTCEAEQGLRRFKRAGKDFFWLMARTCIAITIVSFVWEMFATGVGALAIPKLALFGTGLAVSALVIWLFTKYSSNVGFAAAARWVLPIMAVGLLLGSFDDIASLSLACLLLAAAHASLETILRMQIIGFSRKDDFDPMRIIGWGFAAIMMGAFLGPALYHAVVPALVQPGASLVICVLAALVVISAFLFSDVGEKPAQALSQPADVVMRSVKMAEAYALSNREREVLEYLLEGRSHPYIRDELFISKSTVDTHVRHIYSKTGVKSKQELIDLSKRLAI